MQIICIAVGGAGGGVGIPLAAGGYQGWHTVTLYLEMHFVGPKITDSDNRVNIKRQRLSKRGEQKS